MPRGTCENVMCHGRKSFAEIIKSTDLQMGKLSWIFWLVPIYSHEPLKANDRLHLEFRKIVAAGNQINSQTDSTHLCHMENTRRNWGTLYEQRQSSCCQPARKWGPCKKKKMQETEFSQQIK